MTYVLASPNAGRAASVTKKGGLGILLYGTGSANLAALGRPLLEEVQLLPGQIPTIAWDFLSFALAVFGSDRFVVRKDTADGWTRLFTLVVELRDPTPWQANVEKLATLLRFLTGDIWHLEFVTGGRKQPLLLSGGPTYDCVTLFSGGLDSLIGALDLQAARARTLLVSQATPKEAVVQASLASEIGMTSQRFAGRVTERFREPYEASQRSRSLLFIAYAVVCAAARSVALGNKCVDVFIPENGLISLNPPLTLRRMGSLSTRTTHPFFINQLGEFLEAAGACVRLRNPYQFTTKGEMLASCADSRLATLGVKSYSCGKGKRLNMHCGRCIPCLIRRAAFSAARVPDSTLYWLDDLARDPRSDDIFAARMATTLSPEEIAKRVLASGPFSFDSTVRDRSIDVAMRGLAELKTFFSPIAWS